MSLLETRNKKFNIPFVFIAGVIFLLGLAYFANYLENMSKEAINLELPEKGGSEANVTSISVRLTKEEKIYIDSLLTKATELEKQIKLRLDGKPNPTILLQVDKKVSIDKAAELMEFAEKNNYKIILRIQQK